MMFPSSLVQRVRDEYPGRADLHAALDGDSILNVILMVVEENARFVERSKADGNRQVAGALMRKAELAQDLYILLERQKT